jgi:hypothetical protein
MSFSCFSQRTTLIDQYSFQSAFTGEKIATCTMPFGKADILDIAGDTSSLKDAGDIFIDVVCTDYPSKTSLYKLNKSRMAALLKRFPSLTTKHFAQINFFRQTDGAEKEKAATMFHGIVIKYRAKQSVQTMEADIAELDHILEPIDSFVVTTTEVLPVKNDKDSIIARLKLKKALQNKPNGPVKYETKPYDMSATGYEGYRHSPDDSSINISPKLALKKGLITKAAYKAYDWTPMVTLYFKRIEVNTPKREKKPEPKVVTRTDTVKLQKPVEIPDSTLLKILARVNWKNFTVVGDVTVSMYPYNAQLLWWLKLYTPDKVTNHFVFFNDGDEMPDTEKKIGSTGGIYFRECDSYDQVKKLIKEAMAKGSGGDRPENDVEALLTGEREFPSADFQVLIADNRAPVKDNILSNKLTKPVRVILCGANAYNINPDYLDLARQTKGSVHLMEEDINGLDALQEGEALKIGKKTYRIENGFFVETGNKNL